VSLFWGKKIFKNNRGFQPSQKEAAASNFIRVSTSDPCQPNRPKPGCLLVLLSTTAKHFESAGLYNGISYLLYLQATFYNGFLTSFTLSKLLWGDNTQVLVVV